MLSGVTVRLPMLIESNVETSSLFVTGSVVSAVKLLLTPLYITQSPFDRYFIHAASNRFFMIVGSVELNS